MKSQSNNKTQKKNLEKKVKKCIWGGPLKKPSDLRKTFDFSALEQTLGFLETETLEFAEKISKKGLVCSSKGSSVPSSVPVGSNSAASCECESELG